MMSRVSRRSCGVPPGVAGLAAFIVAVLMATGVGAQSTAPSSSPGVEVTFAKDIAPIFQKSCQECHRPGGIAPMALITFEQSRPWARQIVARTALGRSGDAGAMPPWFVDKRVGIQEYEGDMSLTLEEIDTIAAWFAGGARQGNPADMPPPRDFTEAGWKLGEPDLVLRSPDITVPAMSPDTWGFMGLVPTGMTEDRYIRAVEVREVNDLPQGSEYKTVGAKFVFHHMAYSAVVPSDPSKQTSFTPHNAERNPFYYPVEAPPMLAAGSALSLDNYHMHANGRTTTAHLEFAFKFFPKGTEPRYRRGNAAIFSTGADIDMKANEQNIELHSYGVLKEPMKLLAFDPHMHAAGTRACLEAVWGAYSQTLICAGNDYGFVRSYSFKYDAAPLLPAGTLLHVVGYHDNSKANRNIADSRNWIGSGRRSISNMWAGTVQSVALTQQQFEAEMAQRRAQLKSRNNYDVGCPLCWAPTGQERPTATSQAQGGQ